MASFFEQIANIISTIATTPFPAICSLVGLITLFISGYFSYKVSNQDSANTPGWQKVFIFVSMTLSVLFFISAGALAFGSKSDVKTISKMSETAAICNLYNNTRTEWFIRLIVSDPDDIQGLTLSNLDYIGSPKFKYVFVGDYAELKGFTASEAVAKLGGWVQSGDKVSAIIFRPKHVFPANARGVLQVIRRLEVRNGDASFHRLLDTNTLSQDEIDDLDNDKEIKKWAWPVYKRYYNHYCQEVQKFRCNKEFGARNLMSVVDGDYNPLGFARTIKDDQCKRIEEACTPPSDFEGRVKINYGARIFLTENNQIKNLGGRYLIEFDQPSTQLIPDVGALEIGKCQKSLNEE